MKRIALPPPVAATLMVFIWASAFPAITLALQELDAIPLAAARYGFGAVILAVWLAWRRPPLPRGREWLRVLVCGLLGMFLYSVLLNTGQRTVSAGAASFIVATQPVFAALLAQALNGERLSARGWLGTLIAFSGVSLISLQHGQLEFGAGAPLVLAAAACSGAFFVLQRPLVNRYGALTVTALTLCAGAVMLLPWLPAAFTQLSGATLKTWQLVIYLAVFPGVVGYMCSMIVTQHYGAARATNLLYLMAPLATGMSVLTTDEQPGLLSLFGGALALGGVVLVARETSAPSPTSFHTAPAPPPTRSAGSCRP